MCAWSFGKGQGTHALVVGVGEYPWLKGGNKPLFAEHEGMGQLTSAPYSAFAFAQWLVDRYTSVTHPIRTLRVLISAPRQPVWEPIEGAGEQQLLRATFDNFKSAVLAWRNAMQPTDRAVFFFSGHGMGAGVQHTLVLEDYGSEPNAPLGFAFDFTKFHVAMARAPALEQFYFLDACRTSSGTLMQSLGVYGDPILTPSGALPSPARRQPILYATMPGDAAYGRPYNTSFFTEALLQAMRGAGASRKRGRWVIRPSNLNEAVQYFLDQLGGPFNATQNCLASSVANFDFHELGGLPEVPVVVDCSEPAATVSVNGSQVNRDQPPPVPRPWRLELPEGDYRFSALPPGGVPKSEHVYPPFTEVELP